LLVKFVATKFKQNTDYGNFGN